MGLEALFGSRYTSFLSFTVYSRGLALIRDGMSIFFSCSGGLATRLVGWLYTSIGGLATSIGVPLSLFSSSICVFRIKISR